MMYHTHAHVEEMQTKNLSDPLSAVKAASKADPGTQKRALIQQPALLKASPCHLPKPEGLAA